MPNNRPIGRSRAPLSQDAMARGGIPDVLPTHPTAPTGGAPELSELILALRSGQISPEVLIQLLSMLSGLGGQVPGMQGAMGPSPIGAALSESAGPPGY